MKTNLILAILCASALGIFTPFTVDAKPSGSCGSKSGGAAKHPKAAHSHPATKSCTKDPGVNHRQDNQHDRISQGVKSGQLTKEEAKSVASTQKEIRQEEAQYKSDGILTKDERKDLQQDLHAASKDIYEEKHDSETRPGVTPAEPKTCGTKNPGINYRQENQKERIEQGIQSGELTKKEIASLAHKEAVLARMEKRMKEDGTLTPEERMKLQNMQSLLSSSIYKQKHDGQDQTGTTTDSAK